MSKNECFLILGGAGLVGRQIAREIAKKLAPRRIVIASLRRDEVEEALGELRAIFQDNPVVWDGCWGNIFVREDFAHTARAEMLGSQPNRDALFDDLYGEIEPAYNTSYLVQMLRQQRPDVIVDCINTATAISYQDAHTASIVARREDAALFAALEAGDAPANRDEARYAFDLLVLSQALPQLVRHVQILHRVMIEVETRLYLKIGTTGSGGMGLNIPYTHSEDKPSVRLMTKTAVAFAHTGLMFLMARTPESAIVKEIKPGGMIGYADVSCRPVKERGQPVYVYNSRVQTLDDMLTLREDASAYQCIRALELPVVDTGENGLFTRGEFEAITALRQMEFITPEEIAREAVLEIVGSNTGHDVIAEIDSAIMNPTYRAGYLRQQVLADMTHLEASAGMLSVALGQLGPPELSKLLWEAELLRLEYGSLAAVLDQQPDAISRQVHRRLLGDDDLTRLITSIGLPVLSPDGAEIMRGPFIRIPEMPGINEVSLAPADIDRYAAKGWVDLRPQNFTRWQNRFAIMQGERQRTRGRGSAAITRQAYLFDDIRIGEIAGWIFNNEEDGYRMK